MSEVAAVITGLGPISAIGCGHEPFWQALVAGQHGFGPITRCDVSCSPSKIGAEVKNFHLSDHVANGSALKRRLPRAVQLALAASTLAVQDSGLTAQTVNPERIGVCVGTSVGNTSDYLQDRDKWQQARKSYVSPSKAFYLFYHSAACLLSSFFDFRGPTSTVSTGCNAGLDALGHCLHLVQLGLVDAMLVVGTDCELFPEILAVMNASKSLTTRYNDVPGKASRPFDVGRDGNVIGEGAAALILEAEPHARARKATCYARVAGYAACAAGRNRQYSSHDPEFDLRPCMRSLSGGINQAGWQPGDVDLVNANGSSSVLYDRLEALSLAQVFGEAFPALRLHSIKSMLGQHGAGSSAMQAVSACLSIYHGTAPPTINHEQPDQNLGEMRVVTRPENCKPRNVLVHSIGFGGFYYSCGAFTNFN